LHRAFPVGNHTIHEAHHAHGQVDCGRLLEQSCNIGAATLALKLGTARLPVGVKNLVSASARASNWPMNLAARSTSTTPMSALRWPTWFRPESGCHAVADGICLLNYCKWRFFSASAPGEGAPDAGRADGAGADRHQCGLLGGHRRLMRVTWSAWSPPAPVMRPLSPAIAWAEKPVPRRSRSTWLRRWQGYRLLHRYHADQTTAPADHCHH